MREKVRERDKETETEREQNIKYKSISPYFQLRLSVKM